MLQPTDEGLLTQKFLQKHRAVRSLNSLLLWKTALTVISVGIASKAAPMILSNSQPFRCTFLYLGGKPSLQVVFIYYNGYA